MVLILCPFIFLAGNEKIKGERHESTFNEKAASRGKQLLYKTNIIEC